MSPQSTVYSQQSASCPCPIDHRIVEAVTTWAQISNPVARQTAWSAVVDLLNRKTWDVQIDLIPGHKADDGRQTTDAGQQTSACQIKQPPY